MTDTIAQLKARLSFDVDNRGLKEFEHKLRSLERQVNTSTQRMRNSFMAMDRGHQHVFNQMDRRVRKHRTELHLLQNDLWYISNQRRQGRLDLEEESRLVDTVNRRYSTQSRMLYRMGAMRGRNGPINVEGGDGGGTLLSGGGGDGDGFQISNAVREAARSIEGNADHNASRIIAAIKGHFGGADYEDIIHTDRYPQNTDLVDGGRVRSNFGATAAGMGSVMYPAAAAVGITAGASFISNEVSQRFARAQAALLTQAEGNREVAEAFGMQIAALSDRLGQQVLPNIENFADMLGMFKGTALEKKAFNVFESLSMFATATGMSQERLDRIQLALGQIAATGKLQGDELIQLAEAGISREQLASAMGMTVQQFSERQQSTQGITAGPLITALADLLRSRAVQSGTMASRASSTQAQQNRALNQALFSNELLNLSGLDDYMNNFYQGLAGFFENANPLFEELGEMFGSFADSSRETLTSMGELFGAFGNLMDSFDGAEFANRYLPTLGEIFNALADFVNDVSDAVDVIRNPEFSLSEGIDAIRNTAMNVVRGAFEKFVNAILDVVNVIPGINFDPVSFNKSEIAKVDPAGALALVAQMNQMAGTGPFNIDNVRRQQLDPKMIGGGFLGGDLSPYMDGNGGIQFNMPERMNYPRTHPLYRGGGDTNVDTVNITIDGSGSPEETLRLFEQHFSSKVRAASSSDPNTER